jgi:hypothetical protein
MAASVTCRNKLLDGVVTVEDIAARVASKMAGEGVVMYPE